VSGPLEGIKVLDLTRLLPGAFATALLADLGADVLKVEQPGIGDPMRAYDPRVGESSAFSWIADRNKRSLALNMAVKPGQAVLAALIRKSDVLIDNFKLGTLAKWGFTDAWFEEHAPKVVRCSITGYGATGPKAAQPGYDFILQAESGLMSITGPVDGTPTKHGVALVDVCTGMLASNAILAALNARHSTGRGQKVEVSLYESSLAMLVNVASNYLMIGKDAGRFGNGHPSIVPYTTFPAADGMLALAVGNDAQFAKCAAVLGHPEWAQDERFTENRSRVAHRDLVEGMIAKVLKTDRLDAWIARFQAAGVPCGKINSVKQALDDPQTAARDMIATAEHPKIGALKMLGTPFKLSATPTSVRRAPPTLSQHADEILKQELGMDDAQIAALRRDKVI
ncbi:MAG TPA: CaiB/BaiF CoA-transferase family protein, partial [Burkholderiales bacterium]|nr:CaiB/BaiF CoA-transferase family protein [Burkholderiales bacterium]